MMPPLFSVSRMIGVSTALLWLVCAWVPAHAHDLRLADLQQTRDRPLFSITRRPPPKIEISRVIEPIVAPVVVPVLPPSLTLVGIVLGVDEKAIIVEESPANKAVRLALGGDISGWHVSSIKPRAVVLTRAGRSFTLTFPAPNALAGTAIASRTRILTP